jgi:hypothetical protein
MKVNSKKLTAAFQNLFASLPDTPAWNVTPNPAGTFMENSGEYVIPRKGKSMEQAYAETKAVMGPHLTNTYQGYG